MDEKSPVVREPDEIFQEASREFRKTLTEKDKALFREFPDAQSMLSSIKKDAESHPVHSSALTRCCKGINNIANRLSPFFDVTNLFISSHPEIAALVWGSLRLVFVLGSNHVKFLERVCGMFNNMSMLLPAYEDYLSNLRLRLSTNGHEGSKRIFKTLAYIYADFIQFCFDMCKLFTRKRSRLLKLRSSFAYSTLWKPFDIRFDDLLQRWKEHREIFELEMSVTANIQQFQAGDRVETLLKKFDGDWEAEPSHTRNRKELDIDALLMRLKHWIDPPTWAYRFENSQHRRFENTTDWFLEHYKVSRWLSKTGPAHTLSTLSVQGKPGYGKTTLCATLVEHLQNYHMNYYGPDSVAVVYFFFDQQKQTDSTALAALRAIVAQLLHSFREDLEIVDIMTLLWAQNKTGQVTASGSEILSALSLLLSRISRVFMVIDGVDECQDHENLFGYLNEICTYPDYISVALFSRPTLAIPQDFSSTLQNLDLTSSMNFDSLETFLRPLIRALCRDGIISAEENRDHLVTLVASRANGMFLWARLLVEYLQSSNLSIRQRREALKDLNRLQGLDSLYQEILRSVEQRSWRAARINITRAFQFVSYAVRPLHVDELKVAITTPLSSAVDEYDAIPNFEKALAQMSGALIELDSEKKARFVHVSVLEYLTDHSLDPISQLVKERSLAQRSCASCCLAYLLYSIPAQPLGGGPQVVADRDQKRYPFLKYAAEYWDFHFSEFLLNLPTVLSQECELSLKLASDFLSAKRTLSVWIEACYVFGKPPRIFSNWPQQPDGSPLAILFPSSLSAQAATALKDVIGRLNKLFLELTELKDRWEDVLLESPFEVWEPSIQAFQNKSSWESVPGSKIVTWFKDRENMNYKYIVSVPTPDGRYIGILWLSTDKRFDQRDFEWKMVFEEWSLNPFKKNFKADITLPSSSLDPFIGSMRYIYNGCGHKLKLELPLVISPDLRRIIAPGCVATINRNSGSTSERKITPHIQSLNFNLTPGPMGNMPFRFEVKKMQEAYALFVSDSTEFIMTIHRSEGMIDISKTWSSTLWIATVYKNYNTREDSSSNYRYLSSLAFKPCECGLASVSELILLHPFLPLAAIVQHGAFFNRQRDASHTTHNQDGVILWRFSATGNDKLDYVPRPHIKIEFQDDGGSFYGKRLLPHGPSQQRDIVKAKEGNERRAFDLRMANTSTSLVQGLNTITRATDSSGYQHLYSVKKAGAGLIVRQNLRDDGLMVSEDITKLPSSIFNIADPVIISQDPNVVQVVVNRASRAFEPYEIDIGRLGSSQRSSKIQLPLVIERQNETIPTFIGRGSYSVESGMTFKGEKRLLDWRDSEGETYKRRIL